MLTVPFDDPAVLGLPFSLAYSSEFSTSSPSDDESGSSNNDQSLYLADGDADDAISDFGDAPALAEDATAVTTTDGAKAPKRRSRRPPSTAAKRATHNAIERARRESLNGRFIELAHALPNMASVKRPSKSAIVIKSLEYVYQVQARERAMKDQNAALRQEVDNLRARLGLAPAPTAAAPSVAKPTPPATIVNENAAATFDVGGFVAAHRPSAAIPIGRSVSSPDLSGAFTPTSSVDLDTTTADYFAALLAPSPHDFISHGHGHAFGAYPTSTLVGAAPPLDWPHDLTSVPRLPFGALYGHA